MAGPIPQPDVGALPMIALYAGKYEINQNMKDGSSSQPRPQEIAQDIPVDSGSPQGPYGLVKTPLDGSLRCKIIFEKESLTERQLTLVENKDFTIDYQNATIAFSYDMTAAGHIMLAYSFVGVFTIREFQQLFLIDVYDEDMADVEQWTSLINSMVLTNQNELIEHYNFTDKTEYTANQYISTHTIDRIDLLAGAPEALNQAIKFQFTFQVHGQIKLAKEIVGGFGLIEKIHSPGSTSVHPVDIEIGLK